MNYETPTNVMVFKRSIPLFLTLSGILLLTNPSVWQFAVRAFSYNLLLLGVFFNSTYFRTIAGLYDPPGVWPLLKPEEKYLVLERLVDRWEPQDILDHCNKFTGLDACFPVKNCGFEFLEGIGIHFLESRDPKRACDVFEKLSRKQPDRLYWHDWWNLSRQLIPAVSKCQEIDYYLALGKKYQELGRIDLTRRLFQSSLLCHSRSPISSTITSYAEVFRADPAFRHVVWENEPIYLQLGIFGQKPLLRPYASKSLPGTVRHELDPRTGVEGVKVSYAVPGYDYWAFSLNINYSKKPDFDLLVKIYRPRNLPVTLSLESNGNVLSGPDYVGTGESKWLRISPRDILSGLPVFLTNLIIDTHGEGLFEIAEVRLEIVK